MTEEHSPQLEDGYTRIANEWIEAFIQYPAPGSLKNFVLLVARYTWGYNETWRQIPVQTFQDVLQVSRRRIYQLREQAASFNLIEFHEGSPGESAKYRMQKEYTDWLEYRTKAKWDYAIRPSREEHTSLGSEGRTSPASEGRSSPCKDSSKDTRKKGSSKTAPAAVSEPTRKAETAKQRQQRLLAEEEALREQFSADELQLVDAYIEIADSDLKRGTTPGGRVTRMQALVDVANEVNDIAAAEGLQPERGPRAFLYGLEQACNAGAANKNYVMTCAISSMRRRE